MFKRIRNIAIVFFVGMMFGVLGGISIRYPVTPNTVIGAAELCTHTAKNYSKFKIGITGKVYEVTCSDNRTLYVK